MSEEIDPKRLVFVDECGTHASLAPLYGYAPRGERLRLSVPRKRGENTTLLSSMSLEGMGPTLAVEGATTAVVFEAYVERVLAPSLRKGQIVVMDNLGAHRPKRVRELIGERGRERVYLPSYSPEYDPIEEALAKIEHLLRKAGARTKEALVEAIGAALSAIDDQDAGASSSMPDSVARVTYCETCCDRLLDHGRVCRSNRKVFDAQLGVVPSFGREPG